MTTAANPQDAKMAAESGNPQEVFKGLSKLAVGAVPEPHPEVNGDLLKLPNTDPIYSVIDGYRCHVPDRQTFNNLFTGSATPEPLLKVVSEGHPLSVGAMLVRAKGDEKVYLLSNGVKRWIPSRDIFNLYHFNAAGITDFPAIVVNSIPTGQNIPGRS